VTEEARDVELKEDTADEIIVDCKNENRVASGNFFLVAKIKD
jgi:hypothetical protein